MTRRRTFAGSVARLAGQLVLLFVVAAGCLVLGAIVGGALTGN